jgi:GNAT superfamily N-acetyltransferase
MTRAARSIPTAPPSPITEPVAGVIREVLPPDTGLAWLAIRELRPAWDDEEAFVRHVDEVLRPGGYRIAGTFEAGTPHAVAAAGFRAAENLPWGRFLYVDDLSTLPAARGRGNAGALLEWLQAEAARLGCGEVHLDSGVQLARRDAHSLYLGHGYAITSHHFARRVSGD